MISSRLGPSVPRIAVHYAGGPPFQSMMDLDPSQRAAVLERGRIRGAERFQDPTYVDVRTRVEEDLLVRFREAGGTALRVRPHYSLLGRSARAESVPAPGRAYLLPLDHLPAASVSFTWGDSFRFHDTFPLAVGEARPASLRVYHLNDLPDVLGRLEGSAGRPAWQEIEIQLWFDPQPEEYQVVELRPSHAEFAGSGG